MTTTPILLVEDDANSVYFFEHAAKKLKIENPLRVAKDGREALDYLEGVGEFADRAKHPMPGLIVLDVRLPRATGLEVLRQMRTNPGLPKIIVVMLTSSAHPEDIAQAYALGANAYLVKPLRLEELMSIVQAIKDFWLTHNHPPE
jgi:CheY-like chemotaxis protein